MGGPLNLTWAFSAFFFAESSAVSFTSSSTEVLDFFRIESLFSAELAEETDFRYLLIIFFIDFFSSFFYIDFLFLSALFCLPSMTKSSPFFPGFLDIN